MEMPILPKDPPRWGASSREEPRADPVAWPACAGGCKEIAASDGCYVVDHRLFGQARLDRRELALEVLVEGDEHQTLVEVARLVETSVIVVATAHDALIGGGGGTWIGEAYMGVQRDALAERVEVVAGILKLVVSAQRRAADAIAPDHVLLLEHAHAI